MDNHLECATCDPPPYSYSVVREKCASILVVGSIDPLAGRPASAQSLFQSHPLQTKRPRRPRRRRCLSRSLGYVLWMAMRCRRSEGIAVLKCAETALPIHQPASEQQSVAVAKRTVPLREECTVRRINTWHNLSPPPRLPNYKSRPESQSPPPRPAVFPPHSHSNRSTAPTLQRPRTANNKRQPLPYGRVPRTSPPRSCIDFEQAVAALHSSATRATPALPQGQDFSAPSRSSQRPPHTIHLEPPLSSGSTRGHRRLPRRDFSALQMRMADHLGRSRGRN